MLGYSHDWQKELDETYANECIKAIEEWIQDGKCGLLSYYLDYWPHWHKEEWDKREAEEWKKLNHHEL